MYKRLHSSTQIQKNTLFYYFLRATLSSPLKFTTLHFFVSCCCCCSRWKRKWKKGRQSGGGVVAVLLNFCRDELFFVWCCSLPAAWPYISITPVFPLQKTSSLQTTYYSIWSGCCCWSPCFCCDDESEEDMTMIIMTTMMIMMILLILTTTMF